MKLRERPHRVGDLILKKDKIAHDHGLGAAAGLEGRPGGEAGERRQRAAVDGNSDVGARQSDLEGIAGGAAFQAGELLHAVAVERGGVNGSEQTESGRDTGEGGQVGEHGR